MANGSAAVAPANEESKISRGLIFTAPMRFVRNNKSKVLGQLRAKSRLIIPAHRDPQLGLYRTDAPTTRTLAILAVATLAAARGWYLMLFALMCPQHFCQERQVVGQSMFGDLLMVCRRWTESPVLKAYQLLQVLRGAYGLTEAPSLWYLRARDCCFRKWVC